MPENKSFPPEGLAAAAPLSLSQLRRALEDGTVLEAPVTRCDAQGTLFLDLGGVTARMPRSEAVAPWISGAQREIAVLSRVGKTVCFTVTSVTPDAKGAGAVTVSRRRAQEAALEGLVALLRPGCVLNGVVVGLESFGAFVDIGRGVVALLPTAHICAAHIRHSAERFCLGQRILCAVYSIDPVRRRIVLTHKELLGTWMENASAFAPGETVPGTVRGVKDYGCFIELTPNLCGLTQRREDLSPGEAVSVSIRSIRPQGMKIKLQVVEKLPSAPQPQPLRYWITDGCLERWVYTPPGCHCAPVVTDFTALL